MSILNKIINNDVRESYCSYEVSKLLKEKGFAVITRGSFTMYLKTRRSDNPSFRMKKGELELSSDYMVNNGSGDYSNENYYQCSRPTHQLAIDWINLNFGIWIHADRIYDNLRYTYCIELENEFTSQYSREHFGSPQKAIEAALLHTLKNIIP